MSKTSPWTAARRGIKPSSPARWSDLPDDLLDMVCSRVASSGDRVRLAAVCKPWRAALDDGSEIIEGEEECRRQRRQRERRRRRLLASGLSARQVRRLEEDVYESQRILERLPSVAPRTMAAFSGVGVLGAMYGALGLGLLGFVVGALIVLSSVIVICHDESQRWCTEELQAGVRAVLESTGNADLLPLPDWHFS